MRAFAKLAAIALLGLVGACGGDGGGINDPLQDAAGTYTLKTFNGAAPPIVVFETTGYKLEVTSANYVLTASGTFTNSATFRETENGVATTSTETLTGTYVLAGTSITFTDTDGEVLTGVLSGNNLQFSEGGMTAVFSR